jgi:hypothetical protein
LYILSASPNSIGWANSNTDLALTRPKMTSGWFRELEGETFYERRWKKEQKALGRSKPRWFKSKVSEQTKALASLGKDALARARTNPFELLNLASCSKEASSSRRLSSYAEWDHGSTTSLSTSVTLVPKHTHYLRNRQADPCWGPLHVLNPDRGSRCCSLRDSAAEYSSKVLETFSPRQEQFLTVLESPLPRHQTAARSSLKHKVGNGKKLSCLASKFLTNPNFKREPEVCRLLPDVQLPASKPKPHFLLIVGADKALFGSVADRGSSRGSSLGLPLSVFGGPLLSPLNLFLPASSNQSRPWVPYRAPDAALQLPPLVDGRPLSPIKGLEATPESLPRFDSPPLSPLELFLGLPPTFREPNPDTQGSFQRRNATQSQAQRAQLHLFLAKQKCEPWVERQNGSNEHPNFGTALGSAYSSLRYSSGRFEPQFSRQPSPSARNPWTALHNLKSLADDSARHPDRESALADDLLYLSTLEFREPRFVARNSNFPSAPGFGRALLEVFEEEEDLSSPPPQDFKQDLAPFRRTHLSCHLSGRNASVFLRDLYTQHQELLDKPDSPVELDSPADSVRPWTSGGETAFTALGLRRDSLTSENLARAGFGPSETFAKWSFVEQRNQHRRFLNRDLGSWRRRLGLVKSLRRRLAEEEAALKAVFR